MLRRIVVPILLLLTSCTMGRQTVSSPVLPQARIEKSFTPEIPITKTVGENMIERGDIKVFPGFETAEDFKLPIKVINGPSTLISKGTGWICTRIIQIDLYQCSTFPSDNLSATKKPFDLAIDSSGIVIGVVYGDLFRFNKSINGKLLPMDRSMKGSYKQELIYKGKSKGTITVSYREYIDDMARPFFFQNLTYDLSESREIAFRDLRIEVLEATNSSIKFIVK